MYKQYNTPETAFVLNLDFDISPTHDARFISLFVDSIPDAELLPQTSHTGRPAHHPRMLLKMILFAYSRKVFSGRKIAQMNEESIPMKWLTRDEYVCYRSINGFRVHPETSVLIQKAFIYFTFLLNDHGLIKDDALYIDGTKVEADANRYSFVWRRAVDRYEAKLDENIKIMYDELVEQKVKLAIAEDELDTSEGLQEIIEAVESRLEELEEAIEEEPNVIEGGSQNKRDRRTLKKHHRKLVEDFLPRKKKYEDYNDTFEGRNSFSKTDKDATFMCMKEDAMKNRVLKPGYNLQIATNSQFVIDYDIFPNPSDSRTLRPFLKSIATLNLFSSIVADAGYGSEENYAYVIDDLEKEAVIAYGMHYKEQKKAFKNDPTRRENWHYDEELDCYVDHHGVQFSFSRYVQRTDKNGFTRDFKLYKADKAQETPELDLLALTEKGNQRTTSVNPVWESFKAQAKETLASESGSQKYAQRKIDVETVFGRMKRNFGVRRTHVRGENGVRNDLGILLMTMNLMKLAEMIRRGAVKMRENTSKNSMHKNNQRTLLVLSSLVVYLGLFAQPLKDTNLCHTKFIKEMYIEEAFVRMMNKLVFGRKEVLEQTIARLMKLKPEDESRVHELKSKLKEVQNKLHTLSKLLDSKDVDNKFYLKEEAYLQNMKKELLAELRRTSMEDNQYSYQIQEMKSLFNAVNQNSYFNFYNEALLERFVKRIVVEDRKTIIFELTCGLHLKEEVRV